MYEIFKQSLSFKVLILTIIIALVLICLWLIFKPEKFETIAISAFPSTGPFIPPDSSNCGTNIVLAQNGECPCDSNYSPYKVDKDIYYLGSKLQVGETYCLPKQDFSVLTGCGINTGQALWSQDNNGVERWTCQCKYPSLFNGDTCTTQQACRVSDNVFGNLQEYNIDGTKGTDVWTVASSDSPLSTYNSVNFTIVGTVIEGNKEIVVDNAFLLIGYSISGPGINSGTIITDVNGTTITISSIPTISTSNAVLIITSNSALKYMCDCPSGSYRLPNDPYRCHSDICYAGFESQPSANFNGYECVCDGVTTTKSNISGFCYPYDDLSTCFPLNGTCTCGTIFIDEQNNHGFIVNLEGKIYITINYNKIPSKIDITSNSNIIPIINDIFVADNSIIAFSINQSPTIDESLVQNLDTWITSTINSEFYKAETFNGWISNNAKTNFNIAIPCNSYYYSRPDAKNSDGSLTYCADFPESSALNKTGIICLNPCNETSCGGSNAGTCTVDVTDPKGYTCQCNTTNGYSLSPTGTTCQQCFPEGKYCFSDSDCCVGTCHSDTITGPDGSSRVEPPTCHGNNSSSCLIGSALILTKDGTKRIDEIKEGDMIISGLTGKLVEVMIKDIEYLGDRKLIGINEHKPFATEDHGFISKNKRLIYKNSKRKWKNFKRLRKGMTINYFNNDNYNLNGKLYEDINIWRLTSAKTHPKTLVYDLITTDFSYVANGYGVYCDVPEICDNFYQSYMIYIMISVFKEDPEYLEMKNKIRDEDLLRSKPFIRYNANIMFERYHEAVKEKVNKIVNERETCDYFIPLYFELIKKEKILGKISSYIWDEKFDEL